MSLDEASLLALFLETLFYGVFLALYWLTLVIVLKKGAAQWKFIVPVATLLLCIATSHLIIDFVRVLEAFTNSVIASAYFSDLGLPLEVVKIALFVTQPMIADGVMVWRCYVVYGRSVLVGVLGCIALLANGGIGYYVVWSLSQAGLEPTIYTTAPVFVTTFYLLTMLISLTCTVLIIWPIYRNRRRSQHDLGNILPLVIVVFENGVLYVASVIATLAAFLTGSNGQYPAMDIATPLVGIMFCLIVIQVHFHIGGNTQRDFLRTRVTDVEGSSRTSKVLCDVEDIQKSGSLSDATSLC